MSTGLGIACLVRDRALRMRLIDAWGGDNRNAEETGRQCMPNGGYDLDAWDQAP